MDFLDFLKREWLLVVIVLVAAVVVVSAISKDRPVARSAQQVFAGEVVHVRPNGDIVVLSGDRAYVAEPYTDAKVGDQAECYVNRTIEDLDIHEKVKCSRLE